MVSLLNNKSQVKYYHNFMYFEISLPLIVNPTKESGRLTKNGELMRTLNFKIFALILGLFASVLNNPTFAVSKMGGDSGGGGDTCEDRIKLVRDDLRSWIHSGGSQGLSLPKQISTQQYIDQMLDAIENAKIQCVGQGDAGYPVLVAGTPKICRFDQDTEKAQITCDLVKLNSLSESDQYVLVHHEYAGLAGVELPNGNDSHYEVSNQISEYLVDQVVKRLAIKPQPPTPEACDSVNLRTAQIHVKCITSKGSIYERVSRDNFGEAWKGPDGFIWSDRVGNDTQYDAVKTCRNLGGKLPDRAAFERGESYGFREVLPNMKDRYFWSSEVDWTSSPDPERVFWRSSADLSFSPDPAFGYTFSGNYGIITHGRRLHYYTVRCIGL